MNTSYERSTGTRDAVIIGSMNGFDVPGDVCALCVHALDDDGRCPTCGRSQPVTSAGGLLVAEVEAWLRDGAPHNRAGDGLDTDGGHADAT